MISLQRPGQVWIYGLLVAISCVANSVATEPAPKQASPSKKSGQRFVRRASDLPAGWTEPKSLPNSSDTLKWQRPRQVRMAEIHRPRPSYLRSPVKAAPLRHAEHPNARLNVSKVQPPQASRGSSVLGELDVPESSIGPRDVANASNVPVFADNHPVRFVAGQVPSDANDVFDDVLDDILQEEDNKIEQAQDPQSNRNGVPTPAEPLTENEFGLPGELPNADVDDSLPNISVGEADEATGNTIDQLLGDDSPETTPTTPPQDTQLKLPELGDSTGTPQDLPTPDDTNIPQFDPTLDGGPGIEPGMPTDAELDRYNGRNCPTEEKLFQQAWDEMRRRPISSISLDITPSIQPTESIAQNDEIRERNMNLAPSREWRDRNGRLLARGRMVNYYNGRVQVETDRGQRESISWYALSNSDLCFVSAWWELPSEFSAATNQYEPRNWTMSTFTWTASALCHKPLYFQDEQLERYGHSAGPMKQAALSGAHFFGNILFLPYHMGVAPPSECQYSLGYYRPGSCAPWLLPAVPLSARGARWQLAALVGGLVIFP